ncbi:MAG: hypothetical protein ACE148_12970 [Vicinamibacterales bacterium]
MAARLIDAGILAAALTMGAGPFAHAQHSHGNAQATHSVLQIPEALRVEHEELHRELAALIGLPGRSGEAAKKVASLLHEHFVSEEAFALPPLGLLVPLANGTATGDAREVVAMTDRLEAGLPKMLEEHKAIVAALEALAAAGEAERHPEAVAFAGKLELHAQNEEQVLYPAALVVGEYVKLKFPRRQ